MEHLGETNCRAMTAGHFVQFWTGVLPETFVRMGVTCEPKQDTYVNKVREEKLKSKAESSI